MEISGMMFLDYEYWGVGLHVGFLNGMLGFKGFWLGVG